MSYQILIYCPDQHIQYKATTPDNEGVGGGIVARIRLAQNLAKQGHKVTLISNVPYPHNSEGADFVPLQEAGKKREADVLLLISSGDDLSLEPAFDLPIQARLREVWVQGTLPIKGIHDLDPAYVIAPSNFVRSVARKEWGVPRGRVVVIYNGLTERPRRWKPWKGANKRDPFALMYFSHPSKGLDAALSVFRLLRQKDDRYSLQVFGGNALWGGEDQEIREPGVTYHGTVGQKELLEQLRKCSISLHLQARLEPFGMVVTESMRQGCIPVASPVGAYPETIQQGKNGFLVPGDHQDPQTHRVAAELIHQAVQDPDYMAYLRRHAQNIPWTWENQARVFARHWSWELENEGITLQRPDLCCPVCGGRWLLAADGYHCLDCGRYAQGGQGTY